MGRWTAERWAASTGIAFAIILVVSNFLAGTPPHYNASQSTITAFAADHHKALLVQGLLGGVMLVLFVWFLASFAGTYREAGQNRLSTIMYGAGVVTIGLAAVGDALMLAYTQLYGTITNATDASLYSISIYMYFQLFWAMAALAFATFLATQRSHAMPEWYGMLSLLGGIVFVVGGLSVRHHGFFSPAGAMGYIGFIGFALWVFISSALLVQKHAPAHVMSPAMSH